MSLCLTKSILLATTLFVATPLAAHCPFFGTEGVAHDYECLVQEYQGYADARARPQDVIVVNHPTDVCRQCERDCAGCAKWVPEIERCVILLAAPFGFDDLWEAQGACP